MTEEQLPATCQLDRKRLTAIEAKLDIALSKLEGLVTIDGPIGKLQKEIIINRQVTEAAHKRLDVHDMTLEELGDRQWQIVWKAIGIMSAGGGALFAAVKIVEALAR